MFKQLTYTPRLTSVVPSDLIRSHSFCFLFMFSLLKDLNYTDVLCVLMIFLFSSHIETDIYPDIF